MTAPDDFTAALKGDEKAQLRNIVRSLACHLRCLVALPVITDDVKTSSEGLAVAAMEFLGASRKDTTACNACIAGKHDECIHDACQCVICAAVVQMSGR